MQVMLPKHKIHESLTWNDSRDHLQSNAVFSADYNSMYNKCSTGFAVPQADDRQTL